MAAEVLSARLGALSARLVTLARLSALALLGELRAVDKEERAREAVQRIEQAAAVADFALRYYQLKPTNVAWSLADRPDQQGLLTDGRVAMSATRAAIAAAAQETANLIADLRSAATATPMLAPLSLLLPQIAATLPASSGAGPSAHATEPLQREPVQVLRGPRQVDLDPAFDPTIDLLDPANREVIDSHRAPFFWNLSIREEMASELCSLSMVEYDGLPLAFHRDFAKQAWDEMRHALLFFRLGVDLLPSFLAWAPADHPLLPGARRFAETGSGLPVPRERNLYELTWNATLTERVILMHIDSETPSLATFTKELRSDYCKERPAVAAEIELAGHDEASHARFGKIWFEHLVPEKADRKLAMERTLLLRGVLMLTAFSHYSDAPLVEMMTRFSSRHAEASAPLPAGEAL